MISCSFCICSGTKICSTSAQRFGLLCALPYSSINHWRRLRTLEDGSCSLSCWRKSTETQQMRLRWSHELLPPTNQWTHWLSAKETNDGGCGHVWEQPGQRWSPSWPWHWGTFSSALISGMLSINFFLFFQFVVVFVFFARSSVIVAVFVLWSSARMPPVRGWGCCQRRRDVLWLRSLSSCSVISQLRVSWHGENKLNSLLTLLCLHQTFKRAALSKRGNMKTPSEKDPRSDGRAWEAAGGTAAALNKAKVP